MSTSLHNVSLQDAGTGIVQPKAWELLTCSVSDFSAATTNGLS